MSKLKPIVTDTYDFPTLIKRGYVYVDKTAFLHRMISGIDGTLFFMSRPRRFGKSLMISTLEQIFKGNKALFKGLDISETDYDWGKYPVIRLDMSVLNANSASEYRRILCAAVAAEAARHGLTLEENVQPAWMLNQLIGKLAVRNRKVVVLVDEYDAPLGGLLSDLKMLEAVRGLLHDFYIMLKVRVADIRFLMMTGVSKFSKLSVFSGLNNLTDLSMRPEYAGLLGYTPDELNEFFNGHLKAFAKGQKVSPTAAKSMLLSWYDSYRFSPKSTVRVCNPVSIGRALIERKLEGFWNATGNATLIIERLRKAGKLPDELDGVESDEDELSTCDIRSLPTVPLLYQGGYLTIKSVNSNGRLRLGIPNLEVRTALNRGFLADLFKKDAREFTSIAESLVSEIDSSLNVSDALRRILTSVFAMVPHEWKLKNEAEAKRYFLLFMKMAGADVTPELESSKGRADAVLETEKAVYVFEFKHGKTARAALRQINAKGYAKPYAADRRRVVAIGVNYDPRKAGVEVVSEVVNSIDEVVNSIDEVVNEVVKSHPGLRKPELVPLVGKSRATVERALASLIAAGQIEFRGAPKNGGYYVR